MTNVTISKLKEELDKQRQLLVSEFESRNETLKDDLLKHFDKLCSDLGVSLQKAFDDADVAKQMAADNANEILRLKSTVETLVDTNKVQAKAIAVLTERVEERTNRQLRNTLVFKGIPEPEYERTWEDTKSVLAEAVASTLPGLDVSITRRLFERAHRSRFTGIDGSKKGKRNIFVRVFNWNDSEKLKDDFRKARVQNNNLSISCEQKFGPLTSARRNHALSIRKDLKRNGDIFSGYIAYPAKLMIKKTNSKTEKYSVYDDYSKMEVSFPSG